MTIETSLKTTLGALFSGRFFADHAPQTTVRPFCTYQQVGGMPSNSFCGNSTQQNSRIQINVWAETRNEANTLMRAVEVLLTEPPLRGVSLGSFVALCDEPTKTYGAMEDFSFWMA